MRIAAHERSNRISRISRGALKLGAIVTACVAVAGCTRLDDYTAVDLSEPDKRHAIGYTTHTEALLVEVPSGGGGLSEGQRADVWRFVDRYKKESNGRLSVAAPRSASGHLMASRSLREVESIIRQAGVDPDAVIIQRQGATSRFGPAVRLAYDKPVAVPPECRNWSSDLGENRERLPHNDFGCATQRNLALTVANSRDLQVAQEETPRSSERRSKSWGEYTGTTKETGSSAPPVAPAVGGATPTLSSP